MKTTRILLVMAGCCLLLHGATGAEQAPSNSVRSQFENHGKTVLAAPASRPAPKIFARPVAPPAPEFRKSVVIIKSATVHLTAPVVLGGPAVSTGKGAGITGTGVHQRKY